MNVGAYTLVIGLLQIITVNVPNLTLDGGVQTQAG